jgi:AraC-like DNA-binding protein
LQARSFSTRAAPPADRFDAWRNYLADWVDVLPVDEPPPDFPADHIRWDCGGLIVTKAVLAGAPERAWRHVRRSAMDHWCLVVARPHDHDGPPLVSVRSLGLPFEGRGRDMEVFTLMIPRGLSRDETRDLDGWHDQVIPPAVGGVLADFLTSLARNLPDMGREHADSLAEAAKRLVLASAAPTRDRSEAAEAPLASVMVERARHVVRQNMAAPEFGPNQLCRLLAVSRSKLYRLFENSGGLGSFIQKERLQAALLRLSEADVTRSINLIALDVGFPDHSTFSRAFRREFGFSPSEAREMALARRVAASRESVQPTAGGEGAAAPR